MSLAPERVKQAGEKRTLSFDFTSKLKAGDSVQSAVVTAPSGLTLSASSLSANVVTVQISGGVNGMRYNVDCEAVTVPGADTLKLDVMVRIDDREN